MVHETHGFHHYHKKRIKKQRGWRLFLDRIIYIVGIVGPLFAIPQVLQIWVEKNASGVSLLSWGAFLISAFFWLAYALAHREKPLIMTYSIWIILEIILVAGILVYG